MRVEASMPLATVMPIERLALAPTPLAKTNGSTPRMKANEVLRIGRTVQSAEHSARAQTRAELRSIYGHQHLRPTRSIR